MLQFCLLLSIVSSSILILTANQTQCPGGQISVEGKCTICPAGTYRLADTMNECTPCVAGLFNPLRGVGDPILCRRCPQNTFSSRPGSTACLPCPKNTASFEGFAICKACGPGRRLLPSNSCGECEMSFYSNKTATLECDFCEIGTSLRGATSLAECNIPCPPGTRPSSPGCSPCGVGTFQQGTSCEFCPQGSVAGFGFTSCQPCPGGSFSKRFFESECRQCPPGFTSNGPGASQCRAVGSIECHGSSFENVNGDCERCRQGFFLDVQKRTCERCPPGSVSRGGIQTKCDACLPGQSTDEFNGAACICPQGLFRGKNGKCRKCPPGTGGNFDNVFGRNGCINCNPGFFSDKSGSKMCTQCPIGTISTREGSTKCIRCPPGTTSRPQTDPFATFGASECVLLETGCPLGKVSGTDDFGDRTCVNEDCQVGTPPKEIGLSCTPCLPGEFLKNTTCVECPSDAVSPGGVITSCKKCNNGLVRSFFDPSQCACDGEGGDGKGIQNGVCKDCPPGTFSDSNISECKQCRPGSFAGEFGSSFCTRCPIGTFADKPGAAGCKTCPADSKPSGFFGATGCVPTV